MYIAFQLWYISALGSKFRREPKPLLMRIIRQTGHPQPQKTKQTPVSFKPKDQNR
jgi:hypothetical protein